LAIVHLAKEELISGTASADQTLAAATEICVGIDSSEIPHLLKVIVGLRSHQE